MWVGRALDVFVSRFYTSVASSGSHVKQTRPETQRYQAAFLVAIVSLLSIARADIPPGHAQRDPGDNVTIYPASFFERYQPRTGLDMVRKLPGFVIDDGDVTRGFGGAAGNVLINGRHPSSKNDRPTRILERIPASHVKRIDLVSGVGSGLELRGHNAVANVILSEIAPATVTWEALVRKDLRAGPVSPSVHITRSDRWRDRQYTSSLLARRRAGEVQGGRELLIDGDGAILEGRSAESIDLTRDLLGSVAADLWLGETFLRINSTLAWDTSDLVYESVRTPTPGYGREQSSESVETGFERLQLELGADAERDIRTDLIANVIGLFTYADTAGYSRQRRLGSDETLRLSRHAESRQERIESVARTEVQWLARPGYALHFNLEGVYNFLDSRLAMQVDTGDGPFYVNVPEGNARVEEMRGDVYAGETWSTGAFELNVGTGAEFSRISQSGDTAQSRTFSFIKPGLRVAYSRDPRMQIRGRVVREVSQLDFTEFVTATNFADDRLNLGNPNLRPSTTWVAELGLERGFGEIGVLRMTGYHHWITDVKDLLPLDGRTEVPGNIGTGRRWGLESISTLPIEALIAGARLDLTMRWQNSSVTDPVTGTTRPLSDERAYQLSALYRQDVKRLSLAWGVDAHYEAERPRFKVNEYDATQRRLAVNSYLESSRWRGIRLRLEGEHLFRSQLLRDRTVFTGQRGLSPVAFREARKFRRGQRITLSVAGTF